MQRDSRYRSRLWTWDPEHECVCRSCVSVFTSKHIILTLVLLCFLTLLFSTNLFLSFSFSVPSIMWFFVLLVICSFMKLANPMHAHIKSFQVCNSFCGFSVVFILSFHGRVFSLGFLMKIVNYMFQYATETFSLKTFKWDNKIEKDNQVVAFLCYLIYCFSCDRNYIKKVWTRERKRKCKKFK